MEIPDPERTPERYVIFGALHTGRMGAIMIGSAKQQIKTVCYRVGGIGKGGVNVPTFLSVFAFNGASPFHVACIVDWPYDRIPYPERFGPQTNSNQCARQNVEYSHRMSPIVEILAQPGEICCYFHTGRLGAIMIGSVKKQVNCYRGEGIGAVNVSFPQC